MQNTQPRSSVPSARKRAIHSSIWRLVSRRVVPTLAAAALLGLGAHSAAAQVTYNYTGVANAGDPNNPIPGSFSTGFNPTIVSSGTTSISTTADILSFTNHAIAYTATDDLTGPVALNQLLFQNATGITTAGATNITGTAANTLSFGGATPSITNNSNAAVTISTPFTTTVNGTATAPGLSFNGPGRVVLTEAAANTFTGGTATFIGISGGGTVQDTTSSATANPFGTATIALNGGTLSLTSAVGDTANNFAVNSTNTLVLNGDVALGSGSSTFKGTGTLNVQEPASGTGGSQTVSIGGNMTTFMGAIVLAPIGGTASNATLRLNNSATINTGSSLATFDLGQGTGILLNQQGGVPGFSSPFTLGALLGGVGTSLQGQQAAGGNPLSTYSIGSNFISGVLTTATTTDLFQGTISNGPLAGATTAIVKTGIGSLVLTNNNSSYTGGTTISQGNLEILSGTGTATVTTSATGAGAVNLNGGSGATLSGTGVSAGPLTVTLNGVVAPGVNTAGSNFGGAGTLSVGTSATGATVGTNLTKAVLDYDLSANGTATAAPGANDTLVTGGTLSFGATGAETFNFNELTGSLDTTPYTLISGNTAQTNFNANNITTTFSGGPTPASVVYNLTAGNNLTVTFAAAPEPGQTATMSLIGIGMIGLYLRARQRRKAETRSANPQRTGDEAANLGRAPGC